MSKHPKLILWTVMLVSLLGTIGIALPYPVLAPYFIDYPANELTHFMGFHPKVLLGISLAIYPLGLLIGSIYIDALSDGFGRKKVLLITLCGSVVGYGLTAWAVYAESFVYFILARFLTGLCEGNISIARAIAAELHPAIDRTKALSMVYAATYTGWLLGPVIGGFLMVYGVAEVFLIAGLGMLLATILVLVLIAKDRAEDIDDMPLWQAIRQNNSLTLLKHVDIRPIFWFYFLYSMGLNAFYDFYPVWFVDYYQADGRIISLATVCLTVVMIIVSSTLVARIQAKFGEIKSILTGGLVLSVLLFIQPFGSYQQTFVIFAIIGGTIAMTNGMIPSYLSHYFGHLGQGKVMGLQTSTFCITNVIIATVGGFISILDSRWILLLGALLVFLSVLSLWRNRESQFQLMQQKQL
ncbi:MFS transporter [Marinicella sp. S1101]|uniref:MFS transporter n=1 Tax=Marinicella marina TaxID=2996016 RepID=UPI0022609A30|nr:MFS transporter [Marinicella marina]MCX7553764.1 MFS transporter [Marinicella marina]MDJ1140839.1 MFS transporter [Marinicella marina]